MFPLNEGKEGRRGMTSCDKGLLGDDKPELWGTGHDCTLLSPPPRSVRVEIMEGSAKDTKKPCKFQFSSRQTARPLLSRLLARANFPFPSHSCIAKSPRRCVTSLSCLSTFSIAPNSRYWSLRSPPFSSSG